MARPDSLIEDLVSANRILASEGIVDAFGHVSARHPENADRFLLSRARSPELVVSRDIMEFTLDGAPADSDAQEKPYLERFIHAGLYQARPDVQCVVHSHSRGPIPFGLTGEKLRPVVHSCATLGAEVPVWDAQTSFGETDMLVTTIAMGLDMAHAMGAGNCVLMRGHGSTVVGKSIREAVYTAVYLEVNAELQLRARGLGTIKFLSSGEIEKVNSRLSQGKPGEGFSRSWEYWSQRAGIAGKSAPERTMGFRSEHGAKSDEA
ncbi:MAG TPA: class II aldolase/adducin family protein [Bryobacteraceae bacterium]|nr:class II aldolase/adducin family protein [Bryobacteraceae bacterium]